MRVLVAGSSEQLLGLLRAPGLKTTFIQLDRLGEPAGRLGPADVLVIDVREAMRLPAGVVAFRRHFPSCGTVLVTKVLDPVLMLEAMRAGINECVSEPFEGAELLQAIGRIATKTTMAAPRAEVFAFVGAKGGVGTTTLAVNVASALAGLDDSPTLLVDLDLAHGDAAIFLGCEPRFSTMDALVNLERLDDTFLKSLVHQTKSGLHFLGAANRPDQSTVEPTTLNALIESAAQHYRYVVLDAPRSDRTPLNALTSVSRIVIVANQELASVRSAARMAGTLRPTHGGRVVIALTRYNPNADIGLQDVERLAGAPVKYLVPNNYRVALEALNRGRPIVLENHNRLADALQSLARGLIGIGPQIAEKPTGLLGRLTGRR